MREKKIAKIEKNAREKNRKNREKCGKKTNLKPIEIKEFRMRNSRFLRDPAQLHMVFSSALALSTAHLPQSSGLHSPSESEVSSAENQEFSFLFRQKPRFLH